MKIYFFLLAAYLPCFISSEPLNFKGFGSKLSNFFHLSPKYLQKLRKVIFVKDKFSISDFKQDDNGVPIFIKDIISEVEHRGLKSGGIYKENPDKYLLDKLSTSLIHNEYVNFEDKDIYLLASIMKHILYKNLEEPLIGNQLKYFVTAGATEDTAALIKAIQNLPKAQKNTLVTIVLHLKKIVHHSKINQMDQLQVAKEFFLPLFYSNMQPSSSSEVRSVKNAIVMMLDLTEKQLNEVTNNL